MYGKLEMSGSETVDNYNRDICIQIKVCRPTLRTVDQISWVQAGC